MAFTWKNKRYGYDNIANGSATGIEKHTGATSIPGETTRPNLDSGGNTSTSVLAVGRRENTIKQCTSDDNCANETLDTSNTSHVGHTSGTSITSVFPERVG